ncbi:MAG TPA: hypothetical protein VEB43_12525 [Anaeromyxobacter sp.]|nr:hypothetical protein [Anaeromyxobacter sp.]
MRTDRTEQIAAAVARDLGVPDLPERLAALDASPLGSLLLAVYRAHAARVTPAALSAAHARAGRYQPSAVDARLLHRADGAAYAAAAAFEALDLAPVEPLGACAALGGVDPNLVLGALRGAEVLADPTVALALEAARRRTDRAVRRAVRHRFCTSARCVRVQPIAPPLVPHFRLFALVSAGRDPGDHRFEREEIVTHLSAWLSFAAGLRAAGFRVGRAEVQLSDLAAVEALLRAQGVDPAEVRAVAAAHRIGAAEEVLRGRGVVLPSDVRDPRRELGALHARLPAEAAIRLDRVLASVVPALAGRFPGVAVRLDLSRLEGLGYYPGLALRVRLEGPAGWLPVGDGGFTPWTQALLADRKERFLATAIGTEILCKVYGPAPEPPEPSVAKPRPAP